MNDNNFRILLLEENENLGVMMSDFLLRKNFRVDFISNAKAGYDSFAEIKQGTCIFDVALFGEDAFKTIDKMHELNPSTYIIVLLPKLMKVDRLNVENEIHLSKPFSIEDLVRIIKYKNRLRANGLFNSKVNRINFEPSEIRTFKIGKYIFEAHRKRLTLDEKSFYLTKKEAGLLTIIAENANSLVKREYILQKVWVNDSDFHRKARSMDVYICKLRKLLIDDPNIYLVNHHAIGYQIIGDVHEIEKI